MQGSQTFAKDVVLKFGTRLENTNMEGRQIIPEDTSFAIHRTDLFPYIYLSKTVMRIAGFDLRAYLVYRRTITRPVYEQLNPFPRYVDEYLSEVGNPSLRPQFTRNYEANISVNEQPILAVGVNDTKDIFTNVIYQADANPRQGFRTYDNLGKNKEWYLRGWVQYRRVGGISLYWAVNTIIISTRGITKTNPYRLRKGHGPSLLTTPLKLIDFLSSR